MHALRNQLFDLGTTDLHLRQHSISLMNQLEFPFSNSLSYTCSTSHYMTPDHIFINQTFWVDLAKGTVLKDRALGIFSLPHSRLFNSSTSSFPKGLKRRSPDSSAGQHDFVLLPVTFVNLQSPLQNSSSAEFIKNHISSSFLDV